MYPLSNIQNPGSQHCSRAELFRQNLLTLKRETTERDYRVKGRRRERKGSI